MTTQTFNEQHFVNELFAIHEKQLHLNQQAKNLFDQLPVNKKAFMQKKYYLSASALAHIVRRHWYKVKDHPEAGKFTIPLAEIINYLREAFYTEATPVQSYQNFQRHVDIGKPIGYDRHGKYVKTLTVLTDGGGNIITAFPGPLYAEALTEARIR